MNAYTVTDSDGEALGEFTAQEILDGYRSNGDVAGGVTWSEAVILSPGGASLSLYDFLRSVYPELLAGTAEQPDDPQPDIDNEVEEIENTRRDKYDVYRNFEFEWYQDDGAVSVNDSDGDQMDCLDLAQLKDLVVRGVLPSYHRINVHLVEHRETDWTGRELPYYRAETWTVGDVIAELERCCGKHEGHGSAKKADVDDDERT